MAQKIASAVFITILFSALTLAQQPSSANQLPTPIGSSPATPNQAVASTGLLPVFGVDLKPDGTWVDANNFPGQSPSISNGGSASIQKVWDALKPGGFNLVRISVDLSDVKSAAYRTANLCVWAKSNGLMLDLVLRADGKTEYSEAASQFVLGLSSLLDSADYKSSYDQIAFFELGTDWNNPLQRPQESANQDRLLKAASAFRKAESQISQSAGMAAKPIVAGASFDYEMVMTKAVAGTPFDGDPSQRAYASLLAWLKPILASADIDLVSVSWFPGTLSAGGAENVPTMVSRLDVDLGGKPLVLRTGYSTAFHSAEEQKQYYFNVFSGLASLRATSSADSKLAGIIFQQALNGAKPAANPDLQAAVAKWDWSSKADELAATWRGTKTSSDMTWWLTSIDSSMGLLNAQTDSVAAEPLTKSAGLDALIQISQAVSTASATMPTVAPPAQVANTPDAMAGGTNNATASQMPASAPALQAQPVMGVAAGVSATPGMPAQGPPSAAKGFMNALSQTFQAKSQQGLGSMLDIVFQKLGNSIQTAGTGTGSPRATMAATSSATGMMPNTGGNSAMDQMSVGSMNAMNTGMTIPPTGGPSDPSVGAMPLAPKTPDVTSPGMNPSVGMPGMSVGAGSPAVAGMPASTTGSIAPNSFAPAAPTNPLAPSTIPVSQPPAGLTANASATDVGTQKPRPTALSGRIGDRKLTDRGSSNNADRQIATPGVATSSPNASLTPRKLPTAAANPSTVAVTATAVPNVVLPPATATPAITPAAPNASMTPGKLPTPAANQPAAPISATAVPNVVRPVASATSGVAPAAPNQPIPAVAVQTPIGFAKIGNIASVGALIAGQPGQLVLPVTNPNQAAFSNLKAMLMIDGKAVQTQTLATLAGQETGSVTFPAIVVMQPGSHEVKIGLQLQRPDSKPQMGVFSQMLVVQPSPVQLGAGVSSTARLVHPMPGAATSPTLPKPTPAGTAGATTPSIAPTAGTKHAELTVAPSDLSYTPATAIVGRPLDFHVLVRNAADVPTRAGALVLSLYSDGKLVAVTPTPIVFAVNAKGTYQANWRAAMPAGSRVELVAAVTGDGLEVPGKSQASIQLRIQVPVAPRTPVSVPVKKIP